jgi:hypothetical protein
MFKKLNEAPTPEEVLEKYGQKIEAEGVESVDLEAYAETEEGISALVEPVEVDCNRFGVLLTYCESCGESGEPVRAEDDLLGVFDNRPQATGYAEDVAEALAVDVVERESMTYVIPDDVPEDAEEDAED